eukprot:s25_g38.t1
MKKQLNQVTSTDFSLYEHEDQPVKVSLHPDELDELEEYDLNFDRDDFYDGDTVSDDELQSSPYSHTASMSLLSIVVILLPVMFLEMQQYCDAVMRSVDVKDAFLTVKQQCPTVVQCQMANGERADFGLGKVLPGQRDGRRLWYQDITKVMKDELNMTAHEPYPFTLKSQDGSCYVLIHVDDVLVVGKCDFVVNKFLSCLQSKYEVSTQLMEKPGDEVGFLSARWCCSMMEGSQNPGLFHQYGSAAEYALEIFTDSDWASNKETGRSISCATILLGGCLLYSSSRTQKLVSLSSAEAEVYACSSGASDGLLLARIVAWMTGSKVVIHLMTDSRGILQSQGVGKVRHLSCRVLWLQEFINSGWIKLSVVAGSCNPADIGAKRLSCARLRSLMCLLGMYNLSTATVEGADDPGGIITKKTNMLACYAEPRAVMGHCLCVHAEQADQHQQDVEPFPGRQGFFHAAIAHLAFRPDCSSQTWQFQQDPAVQATWAELRLPKSKMDEVLAARPDLFARSVSSKPIIRLQALGLTCLPPTPIPPLGTAAPSPLVPGVPKGLATKWTGTWGASAGYKSGPELPRQPLFGGEALQGDVLEWKGKFGWIKPLQPIDHPLASRHNSKIYVHIKDLADGLQTLAPGQRVAFQAYTDDSGIGAEAVYLRERPAEPVGGDSCVAFVRPLETKWLVQCHQ